MHCSKTHHAPNHTVQARMGLHSLPYRPWCSEHNSRAQQPTCSWPATVTPPPGGGRACCRIEKKVLRGVQAATLQRTLGWKEMGGLTKQTANDPTPLKSSKAHSVCSSMGWIYNIYTGELRICQAGHAEHSGVQQALPLPLPWHHWPGTMQGPAALHPPWDTTRNDA